MFKRFFSIFADSHFDSRKSKSGSSVDFVVRDGKDESNVRRVSKETARQSTDGSRTPRRSLRFGLHLGRDSRDFQRRNSKLFAKHVELY